MQLSKSIGLIGCVALCACGPDIESGDRAAFPDGVNTLSLYVYDGVTGVTVSGANVEVRIGAATNFAATAQTNFYSLSQIPEGTFPIFVSAPGYQPFAGTVRVNGTGEIEDFRDRVFTTVSLLLYPEGQVTDNLTIALNDEDTGTPVASGTVVAQVTGFSEELVSASASNDSQLVRINDLVPATVVTEISEGRAIFQASQLIFGATYRVVVIGARDAAGALLAPLDLTFQAGFDFPQQQLFLAQDDAVSPVAVSANNELVEVVTQPANTLVVTYPYDVVVCDSEASINATGTFFTPNDPSVSVTVNANVLSLAALGTNADPAGSRAEIDFEQNSALRIKYVGAPDASCVNPLGNNGLRGNERVSNTIVVALEVPAAPAGEME